MSGAGVGVAARVAASNAMRTAALRGTAAASCLPRLLDVERQHGDMMVAGAMIRASRAAAAAAAVVAVTNRVRLY